VQIALLSIKKTDPDNSNIENAARVADKMQAFAHAHVDLWLKYRSSHLF